MNLELITKQVVELSREVGDFIRQERKNFDHERVEQKNGFNDLVSYVDKEAEEKFVNALRKIVPEAGFIAEEGTAEPAQEYNWVIDPIDGTTNFLHNLPIYSTSVALIKKKQLLSGVVYEINADECFHAHQEGDAYLNENVIKVSAIKNLKEGLLATGFPYHGELQMDKFMDMFQYFMANSHGVRRLGSAAADLVYVACGRLEGFYEFNLNPWDIAAGALIVRQAGGEVTDFSGTDNFLFSGEIFASNQHIHVETLKVLKQMWT